MLYANNTDIADIELEIRQESQKSLMKLIDAEKKLIAKIGEKRVAELRRYSQKCLSSPEQEAFKRKLDHDDKKLTWIWFRLKRIRYTNDRSQQQSASVDRRAN
ncbi:hypothetical protein [Methylomonas albis]|nr:hypothetical protein [Methylomonas albis]